ncbi:hypothetical protein [Phascolarctobacterium succinatutens]|uniref:hypothetical protein n=1 Tax=Phascolarctobacterium succinatutens TaxID=626940 RepID=UPI0026F0E5BC|nr:hypothetical protein [Phascolarctobacterium succinatutens]
MAKNKNMQALLRFSYEKCTRKHKVHMKNAISVANFLGKTQMNLVGRFLSFVTDFSLHIKLAYSRL